MYWGVPEDGGGGGADILPEEGGEGEPVELMLVTVVVVWGMGAVVAAEWNRKRSARGGGKVLR